MSSKYNLYELNLLVNNILSNINKSLFYDYET